MRKRDRMVEPIVIQDINTGRADFYVLGKTPLVFNAMSAKTKSVLLLPKRRAERRSASSTIL